MDLHIHFHSGSLSMHNISELTAEIASLATTVSSMTAYVASVTAQRDEARAHAADVQTQLDAALIAGQISDELFNQLDGSLSALNGILSAGATTGTAVDPNTPATPPTDPNTPAGETPVPTA